MTEQQEWNGEAVRKWLESRFAASRSEQDRANRGGRACLRKLVKMTKTKTGFENLLRHQ